MLEPARVSDEEGLAEYIVTAGLGETALPSLVLDEEASGFGASGFGCFDFGKDFICSSFSAVANAFSASIE